jgi:hypothetical protein
MTNDALLLYEKCDRFQIDKDYSSSPTLSASLEEEEEDGAMGRFTKPNLSAISSKSLLHRINRKANSNVKFQGKEGELACCGIRHGSNLLGVVLG